MRKPLGKILAGCLFALILMAAAAPVHALPSSPRRFVDFLDVRCYQISNQPPLNFTLRLDHLNPVLQNLPFETVVLGSPQQLCVPVQKNNLVPPADTLPFIRFVDWKCYAITGPSIDFPLTLTHLNPVMSGLFGPTLSVTLREPQLACVPVVKNNVAPPADVLQLVQELDVKCYRAENSSTTVQNITLTHLNPVLAGLPPEVSKVGVPQQLCVPVMKNKRVPPSTILPYVQFADVLCYRASGAPLGQNLSLRHINPLMTTLPVENVFIGNSLKLCVPVAKNGVFPPGAP
ncbi:MAG TPA: hypothetical protein VFR03_02040 [Thermoanaerobaculia bacterium]|nr:hypothetical protein [Thermoanaerobaculia bacterium]